MYIIIALLILAFCYFILGDKQKKYEELSTDPSLNEGIFNKFRLLFKYYELQGMSIQEINNSKVKMSFDTEIENYLVNTQIQVVYQSSHRLQFIVDIWLLKPVKRYIKGTSFIYGNHISEKDLIKISHDQIGVFFKNALEGTKQ